MNNKQALSSHTVTSGDDNIRISDQEIHLWYARDTEIHDSSLTTAYYGLLSGDELRQHRRFHFEKHRHQYLVTRAMVRFVLSRYETSVHPKDWQFQSNSYGKPFASNLPVDSPLFFNLSHTHGLIVLAIALRQEIGVDVEYLPRIGRTLDIASSFFSSLECEQLFALPAEYRDDRFFDLWTLKESYIKACGMGLSIPLDQFSFRFSSQGNINIEFDPKRQDQPELWKFWQIRPSPLYKVALAIKSETVKRTYQIVMHQTVPLSGFHKVDYPITMG